MVEGKVSEPFDDPVAVWRVDGPSPGKEERLAFLCKQLELPEDRLNAIRYQLLHRTASALIQAQRFHARHALMLVHSFSQTYEHFEDYAAFVRLLGREAQRDAIIHVGPRCGAELYIGWVKGEEEYLKR